MVFGSGIFAVARRIYFAGTKIQNDLKNSCTIAWMIFALLASREAAAQKEDVVIRKGNRYYKLKQIDQSQDQYQKALQMAPGNPAASYNLGNTQFRKNKFEDAAQSYQTSVDKTNDKGLQEKGLYNKGVAEIKQLKLQQSIDSWKSALKLDPADEEARENLEKALIELKKSQPPPPKDQKKNQPNQPNQPKQDNQDQQQPKTQQSKLTKQQAEQLLNALQQKERDLQDKMNRNNHTLGQPDIDW
jgi:Ca-activated chloride channel homolog